MRRLAIVTFIILAAWQPAARADEIWACTFVSKISKAPILIGYKVIGDELLETFGSGTQDRFKLLQNNRYGLVGVSSISEIEPGQTRPTVGGSMVVIDRVTREFWFATTITGQPAPLTKFINQVGRGSCIKQ